MFLLHGRQKYKSHRSSKSPPLSRFVLCQDKLCRACTRLTEKDIPKNKLTWSPCLAAGNRRASCINLIFEKLYVQPVLTKTVLFSSSYSPFTSSLCVYVCIPRLLSWLRYKSLGPGNSRIHVFILVHIIFTSLALLPSLLVSNKP